MHRVEALNLLTGGGDGVLAWNLHRQNHGDGPDLSGANLSGADLNKADLSGIHLVGADFGGANLSQANFRRANLGETNFRRADLSQANLNRADLTRADLNEADLIEANLVEANLVEANFVEARLIEANLQGAHLRGTDLRRTTCGSSSFTNLDLSLTRNLDQVRHQGPSFIGVDTLFLSRGQIPDSFLRGCGVPDALINYLPSLIGSMSPIQFYSCFISYSTKDDDFASRLHGRMAQERIRTWFAPEDMRGGEKIHEQVDQAIRVHDKLLLVLSEHSIHSKWVRDEIRRARKAEAREGRRKLFPIRLIPYEAVQPWESFYADMGEDLAEGVREYFIPDFSGWKDHDAFEGAFKKLLRDLNRADTPPSPGRAAPE